MVRTDPASLPEAPRESHGLFELVPTVARRALELGLSAREPSFHVFVAAAPEVMIEDDIVRYASALLRLAAHPARHRLRPRLRPPRGAAAARSCRRGRGRRSSAAMDALIERLQEEIPAVVEGDEFKRAQTQLAHGARGEEPRGHPPARVARQDARLRRAARCRRACRRSRSSTASR